MIDINSKNMFILIIERNNISKFNMFMVTLHFFLTRIINYILDCAFTPKFNFVETMTKFKENNRD